MQKLSVGNNFINDDTFEIIQNAVIFNTNFNAIKQSNEKYEGFAHHLIAEQLKKWASTDKFISAKLEQRLKSPKDEIDTLLATVMFDKMGRIDLKPVPTHHEYVSGDGEIRYPSKNLPRGWK